jgi:uncharacterized membrane protein YsdA (DUF1294 family)/cold shock CspA family protein
LHTNGKLKTWNDDKGFGFIAPFDGSAQVFIHIKALRHRDRRPVIGDVISFTVEKDAQGRLRAANATLAVEKHGLGPKSSGRLAALLLSLIFLGAVYAATQYASLPIQIFYAYLGLSFVTFLTYAKDKHAAQNGRWRTPEGTLQLLALVGGWPGALIAQRTFRHKISKTSFQVVFWIAVLLNIAALVWAYMTGFKF